MNIREIFLQYARDVGGIHDHEGLALERALLALHDALDPDRTQTASELREARLMREKARAMALNEFRNVETTPGATWTKTS